MGEKSDQSRGSSARSEDQIQTTQQENIFLDASRNSQESRIAELSNKLAVEEENNKKLKESTNRLILAMENKDLFVGRQDTDDIVTSRYGQLMQQIKTWSVPFAEHERSSPHEVISRISKDVLEKIIPNSAIPNLGVLLQSPKNLRLFVRGWVGLAVAEMLFRTLPTETHPESPTRDAWMDHEMARAIDAIEMRLLQAGQ